MGESGERVSTTWATCPRHWDNPGKPGLIPDTRPDRMIRSGKLRRSGMGPRPISLLWGNGPPRRRRVAGLRGRPATLGLRHGPDSYGRQQWGILRQCASATQRRRVGDEGPRVVNPFRQGRESDGTCRRSPANYVPAAAVTRRGRALSGFIGRKARVGGRQVGCEIPGSTPDCVRYCPTGGR